MRRFSWIAGAVVGTLLGGTGCARQGLKEDQAMLGHLSMDAKQDIYTAQHNVEVAQANKAAAERARDNTRTFRDVASKELDGAKAKLVASRKAYELGQQTQSPDTVRAAQAGANVSEKELVAFKAKKDYADRLIDLRDREVELADKQLDQANIELALTRVQALRQGGIAPREDIAALMRDRDDKLQDIAATEQRLSILRDQTNRMKVAWQERRSSFDVASRDTAVPSINAPKDPRKIRPERLSPNAVPSDRTPVRGDDRVNDRSDELLRPQTF